MAKPSPGGGQALPIQKRVGKNHNTLNGCISGTDAPIAPIFDEDRLGMSSVRLGMLGAMSVKPV